jgi:hypothetical protein
MVHAPECDGPEAGTAALEKLGAELGGRGFQTRLMTPDGQMPSLQVTNPQVTALSESVVVGEGWFWWSWAERIAPVGDVSGAAEAVTRVLAHGASST